MIYEVRTYTVKPRSMPEVVKRFGEKYEQRKKYSELTAFFQVEVGPLNTFMHIWGYKDLEERGKIRAAAVKDGASRLKSSPATTARFSSGVSTPTPPANCRS